MHGARRNRFATTVAVRSEQAFESSGQLKRPAYASRYDCEVKSGIAEPAVLPVEHRRGLFGMEQDILAQEIAMNHAGWSGWRLVTRCPFDGARHIGVVTARRESAD